MGGGTFGNRSPVAEFNIWADPEAAAAVFGYGGPLVMAGLDLTYQLLATPARIDEVRRQPGVLAATLADLMAFFTGTYVERHEGIAGAAVHDPCAVLALTHPELFERQARHVAVETTGTLDPRHDGHRPAHAQGPPAAELRRAHGDRRRRRVRHHRRRHRLVRLIRPRRAAAPNTVLPAMSVDPTPLPEGTDSYPRQSARTQRYTLGEPRDVIVSPDGRRIVFLRSRGGTDPVNCLWVVDATTGEERLVADPEVLGRDDEDVPPEERARRERTRESAGGITSFATDADVTVTAFAIGGRLFVGGLISGSARELPVAGPVFDPRPDPQASRVAYVNGRLLCVGELDGRWRLLAGGDPDEPETVTWGSADFIAAEEMDRYRGFWWSPDGSALAVTRVDTAPVQRWHLGDPADPATAPTELPYPAAGTANPDVTLHVIGLDGTVVDVEWDRESFPYLADVHWSDAGLMMTVQRRDQRVRRGPPDRPVDRRHGTARRGARRGVGRPRAGRADRRARRRRW